MMPFGLSMHALQAISLFIAIIFLSSIFRSR